MTTKPYYTELEYLESTGTQYIDTGITGNCRWKGSAQSTSIQNASQVIVCSSGSAGTGVFIAGPTILEKGDICLSLKQKLASLFRKRRDYTPLKYLISDGNQWIDTGKTVTNNSIITVAGKITDTTQTDACIWGVGTSGISNDRVQTHFNQRGLSVRIDGTLSSFASVGGSLFISEVNIPEKKGYINGNEVLSSYSGSIDTTHTITLFKRNSTAESPAKCAIGSFRHYTSTGELITDMVPILDKHGVPCMWDRVTNRLFYNEGTGDFTYEEWDYTELDYVRTDGNAYFNTFYYGNLETATLVTAKNSNTATNKVGILIGTRTSATEDNITTIYPTNGATAINDFGNYNDTRQQTSLSSITAKITAYNSKNYRYIINEDTGTIDTVTTTYSTAFTTPTPIYVAYKSAGYSAASMVNFQGDIYRAQIWEKGVLVRDMIPVVNHSSNICGFYDRCLNLIFNSIGSSEFEGHIVVGNNDYKLVHYILSSGTQKIDTGLYFDVTENFETMARVINYDDNRKVVIGDYTDPQHCSVSVEFGGGTEKRKPRAYIQFTSSDTENSIYGTQLTLNTIHKVGQKWVPSTKTQTLMYDSIVTSQVRTKTPTLADPIYTMKLFLDNRPDTSALRYPLAMYNCFVKQSDVLVRYYIPVIRTSDSAIGMFDKVNKTFAGNIGTGTFTTG